MQKAFASYYFCLSDTIYILLNPSQPKSGKVTAMTGRNTAMTGKHFPEAIKPIMPELSQKNQSLTRTGIGRAEQKRQKQEKRLLA